MKRIFLLLIISTFFYKVQAQVQVSYAVLGYPDDWQLFMSKKLLSDLSAGGKTVFITLTAGDEGNGNTAFNGSPIAYYLAKERGAVYSSKVASDITNSPIYPLTYALPTLQTVTVNGKSLAKYVYGNASGVGATVNYFLRLPDGGPTGAGFAGTGLNSLKKLKLGTISSITSVDGVNTYTWTQLLNTIFAIILAEKGGDTQVWLNTASLNATTNPSDRSDHFYSATAAQEAVSASLAIGINEFVMDFSSTLTANLTNPEFADATASFGIYNWSLIKDKYPSKLNSTTRAWLPMESFAINRSPLGTLPVTLLDFSGRLKANNVLLEWTTSLESNSKEFQIEKSADGITYRKLSTVAAAGNSSVLKQYNYLDIEATEINYYRLKMVDNDGYTKQSNIILIKNSGILSQAITVLNTPFTDYIDIRFAKIPKGKTVLKLFDLSGRLISVSEKLNATSSIIRFDNYNKSLSKAVYLLQVETEGKQYNIKLLKD